MASGLVGVYHDIGRKMSRDLRVYGANLVLAPAGQATSVSLDEVSEVAAAIDTEKLMGYMPYLYGVAWVGSHQVVVAGTRLDQVEEVSPYWKIAGNTGVGDAVRASALVGEVVANRLGIAPGHAITLTSQDGSRTLETAVTGVLSTGSREDAWVIIDLEAAARLFDQAGVANVAYLSVVGGLPEVEALAQGIEAGFPGLSASPIKQLSQAEGHVLAKIRALVFLAAGIIVLLTLCCVAITMMNTVIERRQEIGVKKALGAHDGEVFLEFVAEGALLGTVGGVAGWALGLLFAQGVEQSVFQSSIGLRLETLPVAVLFSTGLAGLASFIPARAAAAVQPAATLRGE